LSLPYVVALCVACSAAFAAEPAAAATFTVNNTGDGAGSCPATCTLRAAINAANAHDNDPGVVDLIEFSGSGTITLGSASPLPTPDEPVTIDAGSSSVEVTGGATYVAACLSDSSLYALDLTDPAASGSSVRRVAFNGVCGRAIESTLAAPAIRVGPRRTDNTLPITGNGSGSATAVDLYNADAGDADGEASSFFAATSVAGGAFYYLAPVEPTPGTLFTATFTDAGSTSSFAARTAVPSDIASPTLLRALAVSRYTVRVDFSEAISQASLSPADFALSMGGSARPVTAATAIGNSVFVDTSVPWKAGEAGGVNLTGAGVVTDSVGNEILGAPSTRVYPSTGKTDKPVVRSLSIRPGKICKKKTRKCKRTATRMRVSLNEPARITTTIVRAQRKPKQIVRFRDKLDEGVSWVKIKNEMVGRKLPRGRMVVTVVAEDVARNTSDPAETIFEVR
jgi:CSLREA domain-containing protein